MLHGRFAAALAGVVVAATGIVVIGLATVGGPADRATKRAGPRAVQASAPSPRRHHRPEIPKSAWGTVVQMGKNADGSCPAPGPCQIEVILAPISDARHRLEISWTKLHTFPGSMMVAPMRDLQRDVATPTAFLEGQPMAQCGMHLQGEGVNAIVISDRACVPSSAAKHATAWARIENLTRYPRLVMFRYTRSP